MRQTNHCSQVSQSNNRDFYASKRCFRETQAVSTDTQKMFEKVEINKAEANNTQLLH
jgi:hypothetical protein